MGSKHSKNSKPDGTPPTNGSFPDHNPRKEQEIKDAQTTSPSTPAVDERAAALAKVKLQVDDGKCHCFIDGSRYAINIRTSLGEGGYGKVYDAIDKDTNEHVAIKVLDYKKIKKGAIERECHMQELVRHKNIIELKGIFYDEKRHSANIVMEVASGGDLFDAAMGDGYDEAAARIHFKEIVEAVLFCHQNGVAHRDLKLENVLLDAEKHAKVCDFGLAHLYQRTPEGGLVKEMLHDLCGSMSYMAPEVTFGRYDGFEADVWSLGVCLFTMLVKFFPMEKAAAQDWRFKRIQRAQYASPPTSTIEAIFTMYRRKNPMSAEVTDLLDGMLSIDPRQRLTMPEILDHPWVSGKPRTAPFRHAQAPGKRSSARVSLADVAMMEDDDEGAPQYRSVAGEVEEEEEEPQGAPPMAARQHAPIHDLHLHEGELGCENGDRGMMPVQPPP